MTELTHDEWAGISESLEKRFDSETAQDALLKVLEAMADGRDIEDVWSYAIRTALNVVRDRSRLKNRQKLVSIDAIMAAVDRGMATPEQLIDTRNPEIAILESQLETATTALRVEYFDRLTGGTARQRVYHRDRYRQARKELD